jgi:hypothetical protein
MLRASTVSAWAMRVDPSAVSLPSLLITSISAKYATHISASWRLAMVRTARVEAGCLALLIKTT